MRCQNCNRNEADKTFVFNWMGTQYQMSVCNECLEQMYQYAGIMGQGEMFQAISGWWPGEDNPRERGESPFPADAGREMKLRIRIAALRARLEKAVSQENYEEAAQLRDRIAAEEKGEYLRES